MIAVPRFADLPEPGAPGRGTQPVPSSRAPRNGAFDFHARLAHIAGLHARACASAPADEHRASAQPSEEDVIGALASGEGLRVVFQPQHDLHGGAIVGAEALIRWQHPVHGEIPPGALLPVVNRLGLDRLLFGFVKGKAIDLLSALQRAQAAVPIAVNASARTLSNPAMNELQAELLAGRMRKAGLPHALLKIELTEDLAATDEAGLTAALSALQAKGFTVSLDDFGAGWSGPDMLARVPVDEIKIDALFVQTLPTSRASRAFVEQLIDFAREFGFALIAEGVSTARLARELRELGCPTGQGFALSRPLEASALHKKLIQQQHLQRPPTRAPQALAAQA